jgi:hypothetical protein
MSLSDPVLALQLRDIVRQMVATEVNRLRPKYRYGVVQSIDRANYSATVLYSGETIPVKVKMGGLQPGAIDQTVRVEGTATDRYITDVVGGGVWADRVIDELFDATGYTLTTASGTTAGTTPVCPIVVNLDVQKKIMVYFRSRYNLGSPTAGRMIVMIAYNLDTDTPDPATAVGSDAFGTIYNGSGITGANGSSGDSVRESFILGPGTHVIWGGVRRQNGGSSSDTASASKIIVEDYGPV